MPPSHQYGNFAPMKASFKMQFSWSLPHANQLVVRISALSKHKQEFLVSFSDHYFSLVQGVH
jgi:hypothetical protein